MNEEERPFSAYQSRLITFGGSFKSAEWEWESEWLKYWLPKFENLLGQMFWDEAFIHLHGAMGGGYYKCSYKAENTSERFYRREPPLPVATWKFTGGWDESGFF